MDLLDQKRKQFYQILTSDGISAAIKFLKEFIPEGSEKFKTLILIESQFSALQTKQNQGILDYEKISLTENKIRKNLIDLMSNLNESDFIPHGNLKSISDNPKPLNDLKTSENKRKKPLSIFISYAHEDEYYKERLIKHLSGLRRRGLISEWNDNEIKPGDEWDETIKIHLEKADIILMLVSSDFINSDYINEVELKNALTKYEEKRGKVIPIIVRSCDFSSHELSRFQALPKNAKPVKSWSDEDEAFLDIVLQLKRVIEGILRRE